MAGSFLLMSAVAFCFLLFIGYAKTNVAREIKAQLHDLLEDLLEEEKQQVEAIVNMALRVHRTYVRIALWSWVLMMIITLVVIIQRQPLAPNGSAFLLAFTAYIAIVVLLDGFRYAPIRRRLNHEIMQWFGANPEGKEILGRINHNAALFDNLPEQPLA